MMQSWIEFGTGLLMGGLGLSAGWGLFWLTIVAVGFRRRTCNRRVLLSAVAAFGVPLVMIVGLVWVSGVAQGSGLEFVLGLPVVPVALVGLGLRRAPDGRLAGSHMVGGVRHLTEKLLGNHQACSGCDGGHGERPGGCG